jgi:hypothetical protein
MAVVVGLHLEYAAEGTDESPRPLSFRGVDSASYFRVASDPPGALLEHPSGGGCAFDFSKVQMRAALLDALRHWVIYSDAKKSRVVMLGFGTARQKLVLE